MNSIFLVLQEHAEDAAAAAHAPEIFGLNAGPMVWTFIIFILLVIVLSKYAFPPILGYAAAREARIQKQLDEAQAHREESERLLEQQRQELAAARMQAQAFIAEGKQAADRVRDELLVKARAEQAELVARAKQDIESERQKAVESLRREAVDLALAAAGRLIGQRINASEDRKLVTEYLATVKTGQTGAGAS